VLSPKSSGSILFSCGYLFIATVVRSLHVKELYIKV